MAKRPKVKRSKPKGPKQNPNAMMAQVQQMQAQMAQAQENLADETVTVTAGGGAISIVITGQQRVQSIAIEPDIIDPEDAEMLQDMLVAGINAAIEQSQAMAAQKMEGITGDMGGLRDMLGGLGL